MHARSGDTDKSAIYGVRARIGYICPPLLAEVFPYEFYKIVPAGVTLVITTLGAVAGGQREFGRAYEASLHAARALAAAGVNLVFLGGVPVNLARGVQNARELLDALATELQVKVSSSAAAQEKAAHSLGCRSVVIAHGYGSAEEARLVREAERYGCKVLGIMGHGASLDQFGSIPARAALDMGRELMRRHPNADGIFMPSPHWPVIECIEALEAEFGVPVMAASPACIWDALRLSGVHDRISGYGRLLREF